MKWVLGNRTTGLARFLPEEWQRRKAGALIINEPINYSAPPLGSVLATVGPELFRELDTEDALYRPNYVEINYS